MIQRTETRAERLREAIEERIATGEFPPGMHLDETELAQRFGVSRTPLREALIQLSSTGIVALRPRRGAVVEEVTPQRLLEMFEVMAELEALCGRLAARRMTESDQAALLQAHKACEAACRSGDADAYYHQNEHFHLAVYAGSHSGFLIEQTRAMHRRLRPYRRLQLRVRNRVANSYNEHGGIVDALLAGDAELASGRLRAHILVQGERFTDLLASLASLQASRTTAGKATSGITASAQHEPLPVDLSRR